MAQAGMSSSRARGVRSGAYRAVRAEREGKITTTDLGQVAVILLRVKIIQREGVLMEILLLIAGAGLVGAFALGGGGGSDDSGDGPVAGEGPPAAAEGTTGADFLEGTFSDDIIFGRAGDDTITGGIGNDSLDGNADNDEVFGGIGDDTVLGGAGADSLEGDEGQDSVRGGDGDDTVGGGPGNDTVEGAMDNDLLYGDDGFDLLRGGPGEDTLLGGDNNDTLEGGPDADLLLGEEGDDSLSGNLGADGLDGGAGRDTLDGGPGNDVLVGGAESDFLDGGSGDDFISGIELQDLGVFPIDDNAPDTLVGSEGADEIFLGTGDEVYGEALDGEADGLGEVFVVGTWIGSPPPIINDFDPEVDQIDVVFDSRDVLDETPIITEAEVDGETVFTLSFDGDPLVVVRVATPGDILTLDQVELFDFAPTVVAV